MQHIKTRSPFRISKSWQSADPETSTMELRIRVYRGYQDNENLSATNPTHVLETKYVGEIRAVFEISELVRDYIEMSYIQNGSLAAWVDYSVFEIDLNGTETARGTGRAYATEGYTEYLDGGFSYQQDIYMTPRTILVPSTEDAFNVPVSKGQSQDVSMYYVKQIDGVDVAINAFTVVAESANHSHDNTGATAVIDYIELETTHASNEISLGILKDSSDDSVILKLKTVDCTMYTPKEVIFVNKYGALESMWFFGNTILSDSFTKESYKADIINVTAYNLGDHQYRTFRKNGLEMQRINTGYLPEDNNETIKQLLMSEYVWIKEEHEGTTFALPVTVEDSSFTHKTSRNEKLIDYSITFKKAYDNANTI